MSEELEQLERIERQIPMPKKPKPGTVSGWILCLFFWGAAFAIYFFYVPEDSVFRGLILSLVVILSAMGVICLASIFASFFIQVKEYRLSLVNEQEYRRKKALQFIVRDKKNKEADRLFVEYTEKRRNKKLPYWVENAIFMKDPLTIQYYLKALEEEKF